LAANLRSARAAARAANVEHALTVDLARRRYWAEGVVGPRQLPGGVAMELTVPESERLGANAGRVRFLPDGSASGARFVLGDGRSVVSVSVDWLTGDVRLEMRP
jgi:general secretion pathway protein H